MHHTHPRWATLVALLASLALACGPAEDDSESLATTTDTGAEDTDAADVDAPPSVCGDGVLDPGEACDGTVPEDQSCEGLGLGTGTLSCDETCALDTSGCAEDPTERCGDGVIDDASEECDVILPEGASCTSLEAGYIGGDLGCTDACRFDVTLCITEQSCGDGIVSEGEECDDGNNTVNDGCAPDCVIERCGDGIRHEGEACDTAGMTLVPCEDLPGQPLGFAPCEACELGDPICPDPDRCGDGVIDLGEACDDGNEDPDDGCDGCLSTTCGDGVRDPYELCDGGTVVELACEDLGFDAGAVSCSETCAVSIADCHHVRCGDGVIEGDEACDDGNLDSGDGCSTRCLIESCGDGEIQADQGEQCDGDVETTCGDLGFDSGELRCSATCLFDTTGCERAPYCGDGIIDEGEACDDGELNAPDGAFCTDACAINPCFEVSCALPNAASTCDGGLCVLVACDDGYLDLDADPTSGCEYACTPSGDEVCDGVDNDCDGAIDEEVDFNPCGGCAVLDLPVGTACGPCNDGTVVCDGTEAIVCSGASSPEPEVCDGRDNDCNGEIDDGVGNTYYRDTDGDDYGDPLQTTLACARPGGYVADSTDCDDTDPGVHPDATELCNGVNDDCDGLIDEDWDFDTDPLNCGLCGVTCDAPHASATCDVGFCEVGACDMGYGDCNMVYGDGCEVHLDTDADHCGACGSLCAPTNATGTCVLGMCRVGLCDPGFHDVDGDPSNGCEYMCTPSGPETCDYIDNDCNGVADDGIAC